VGVGGRGGLASGGLDAGGVWPAAEGEEGAAGYHGATAGCHGLAAGESTAAAGCPAVRTGGIGGSKISGVEVGSGVGELAGAYGNEFLSKMTYLEMMMRRVARSRQR
jgi:hypothetical protein